MQIQLVNKLLNDNFIVCEMERVWVLDVIKSKYSDKFFSVKEWLNVIDSELVNIRKVKSK